MWSCKHVNIFKQMTSLVKFTDTIARIQSLKLFQVAAARGLQAEDAQRLWSLVNMAWGRAVFWHRAGSRVLSRKEILTKWAGESYSSTARSGGEGAGEVDETCGVQGSAVLWGL